jgi:uncharacterized protein YdaU (DUF1376 family)
MAKDPAFLFYSNDFLTGTLTLSFEDRGKYITLLCLMHQQGRLNEQTVKFIVGEISSNLMNKFCRDTDGNWYNKRLEEETERRNKFTESRRNNAKKKSSKDVALPLEEHMFEHMHKHMENENKDIINTITINKNSNELIDSNSWESEKKYFKNDEVYFYKICSEYKFSKDEINLKIEEFLKSLELGEDFKSVKELKRHFSNWIKKKKKETSEKPFNPNTATGTEKAAEYERRKKEYAEQNKSNVSDFNPYNFEDN